MQDRRPRWIASSEICIILHIAFWLPPRRLSPKFSLLLRPVSGYKQMFYLADTPQKLNDTHRVIRFIYPLIFFPSLFIKSEIQLFRLGI